MLTPVVVRAARVEPRRYDPPHVLWYFGGITAALAANATIAATSSAHRGAWQLLVALLLLGVFALVSGVLLGAGWWVPGGVVVAASVSLVPALGQAFERLVGATPDVVRQGPAAAQEFQGAVFALALATAVAGLVAFALVRFVFILAPVAIATVVSALLLVPAFVDRPGIDDYASALLVVGAALFLAALFLDTRRRRDEAFWLHLFGLLALAAGFVWYAVFRNDTWAWVAMLVIGAALLLASAALARATWASYGLLGVYGVLVHYFGEWVGSWKQPALLLLVSLALLVLGCVLLLSGRAWTRLTERPRPPDSPPAVP